MRQEPKTGTDATSQALAGVLNRFKAWRATDGVEAGPDDSGRSWKLVYGEAMESINRLSQTADPPTPSLAAHMAEENSVTDTVTIRGLPSKLPGASVSPSPNGTADAKSANDIKGPNEVNPGQVTPNAIPGAMFDDGLYRRDDPVRVAVPLDRLQAGLSQQPQESIQPMPRRVDSPAPFDTRPDRDSTPDRRPVAASARNAAKRPRVISSSKAAKDFVRDTSLTVRLTSLEAALLKRRAEEAGVSVSAYLRHCALDVANLSHRADTMRSELDTLHGSNGWNGSSHTSMHEPPQSRQLLTPCDKPGTQPSFAARALRLLGVASPHA